MPVGSDNGQWLAHIWAQHRGKLIGGVCGLLFGVVVMLVGILWTLFITLCVAGGVYVGFLIDGDSMAIFDRITSPGDDN